MHATDAPAAGAGSRPALTIPLRSRRVERAQRLLPLRDAVAALALAWAALPRFRSGVPGEIALAAADVVVALALVVAIVRENTHRAGGGAHGHDRVAWTDVAAGVMLLVEAYHQRREGRPGRMLPYATALIAAITLYKGLAHERFAARASRRRVLRLDDDGMLFRWSRLHRVRVARRDVASIEASERAIVVRSPAGAERSISLRDAVEPARVVAAVRAWADGEGIPVGAPRAAGGEQREAESGKR